MGVEKWITYGTVLPGCSLPVSVGTAVLPLPASQCVETSHCRRQCIGRCVGVKATLGSSGTPAQASWIFQDWQGASAVCLGQANEGRELVPPPPECPAGAFSQ